MCGFCMKKILEELESGGEELGQESEDSCDGKTD